MDFSPPNVRFQPLVSQEILAGIQDFARLVRPTLGPLPRSVLLGQNGNGRPRLADSGGLIAEHLLRHPAARENVGLQFAAAAVARLQSAQGDGTAAAGVMLERLVTDGGRVITAGANPMLLRRYLEEGLRAALGEIDRRCIPLLGREALTKLAYTICADETLSRYLGEIFDVIGEYGRLEIRKGQSAEFEREYVEGLYWDRGMVSTEMANRPVAQEAFLENPAIFITNYYFAKAAHVAPILDAAVQAGFKHLLLISTGFSTEAMALMVHPSNRERVWTVAVTSPVLGDDRLDFIEDLAAITGATPLLRTGDFEKELEMPSTRRLKFAQPENFGHARRAWVTTGSTGISGGRGDTRYLRQYIGALRRRLEREENEEYRQKLRERISKLLGGSVTLWVGASNPILLAERTENAERTAQALRGALHEGVVWGGGVALLACTEALTQRRRQAVSLEERAAYDLLIQAVQEPARALIENAGYLPEPILEDIRQAGDGYGFDALRGEVAAMQPAGILDAAAVVKASLRTAVSAACSALTTDIIIRQPGRGGNHGRR